MSNPIVTILSMMALPPAQLAIITAGGEESRPRHQKRTLARCFPWATASIENLEDRIIGTTWRTTMEEREEADSVRWIGRYLQDYPVGDERARQLATELASFRHLLRVELPALAFDEQPSDFRAIQLASDQNV